MGRERRAMQDDDTVNPAMPWGLFNRKTGQIDLSCARGMKIETPAVRPLDTEGSVSVKIHILPLQPLLAMTFRY